MPLPKSGQKYKKLGTVLFHRGKQSLRSREIFELLFTFSSASCIIMAGFYLASCHGLSVLLFLRYW